jgi:SAM-dependent methyltransferase
MTAERDIPVKPQDLDFLRGNPVYSSGVCERIHPRDDIYAFIAKHPALRAEPVKAYFQSGVAVIDTLASVLARMNRSLANTKSILEFACGYGRVTRFLVRAAPNSRIAVSDIDRNAVNFELETFPVEGFYSCEQPEDLQVKGRYELVFVASLFSHLPERIWRKWLARLHALLEPDGLLILSTHGPGCLPKDRSMPDSGFAFFPHSESSVLAPEIYGTTYVTVDFVRREAEVVSGRAPLYDAEKCLWNWQDLYVLGR